MARDLSYLFAQIKHIYYSFKVLRMDGQQSPSYFFMPANPITKGRNIMAKQRQKKANFYLADCSCCKGKIEPKRGYWSAGWVLHPECYDMWFPAVGPAPRKKKPAKVQLDNDINIILEKCFRCQRKYVPNKYNEDLYLCEFCYHV